MQLEMTVRPLTCLTTKLQHEEGFRLCHACTVTVIHDMIEIFGKRLIAFHVIDSALTRESVDSNIRL